MESPITARSFLNPGELTSMTYTDLSSQSAKDLATDLSLTRSALAVVQESLQEVTELMIRLLRSVDATAENDHSLAHLPIYSLYLRILTAIRSSKRTD